MVNITRWDPFKELDELQRQFFQPSFARSNVTAPAMDIYTKDNKVVAEVQLGSFDKDDIDVSVHDGILEVRAEKSDKHEEKDNRKYLLRESASSFYRSVRLPKDVEEDKVDAQFDDGILKVTVPLKQKPEPKKIDIKSKKKK